MKSLAFRAMLVAAALGAAVFALAGAASASHVKAEITTSDQVSVGEPMEVQAALHTADEGAPLANTPVVFYMDASFGGVDGEIELGRAVTDENGIATLRHEPRAAGDHEIRVEYFLDGESEPETATASISVAGVDSQLHRSTAGVQIPGLNVWLLIALVATVWTILLSVALRVIAIAHAGVNGEREPVKGVSGGR